MYKHILVALDGMPASEQALKQAIFLAKLTGARLTGISVIEKLPSYAATVGEVEDAKGEMEKYFARIHLYASRAAEAYRISLKTIVCAGNAAQTIIRFAEGNDVDMLVIGSEGRRGLGGTADKITENASCSVLIARVHLPTIRVKDVMTRNILTIAPATPLSQVVELLIERGVKAVPVVEENQVIGIITGGDLISRAGMGLRLSVQRVLAPHLLSDQIDQLNEQGKTAKDIMTSPVITIDESENVQTAIHLMTEKHIKRLPVLDEKRNVVGIISRTDILALIVSNPVSSELFPAIGGNNPRTAGEVMFRDVPTVDPDTPMAEIINKILATPLRRVVVIDENKRVLGIIVDTDLIKIGDQGKTNTLKNLLSRLSFTPSYASPLIGKASDVMTHDVYAVVQNTPLLEVIQLMLEKQIKRLIVTDDAHRLVGMVSRESILHVLAG